MGADLKPRLVPAGVGVRAPLDVPELDLVRGARRVHGDPKRRLQELVPLLPIDLCLEPERPRAGVKNHPLLERRRAELARERDGRTEGSLRVDRCFREGRDVDAAEPVVRVDIPRVPVPGVVVMQLEEVAPSSRSEHLTARLLVPDRCEQPIPVPPHAEQAVLHPAAGN